MTTYSMTLEGYDAAEWMVKIVLRLPVILHPHGYMIMIWVLDNWFTLMKFAPFHVTCHMSMVFSSPKVNIGKLTGKVANCLGKSPPLVHTPHSFSVLVPCQPPAQPLHFAMLVLWLPGHLHTLLSHLYFTHPAASTHHALLPQLLVLPCAPSPIRSQLPTYQPAWKSPRTCNFLWTSPLTMVVGSWQEVSNSCLFNDPQSSLSNCHRISGIAMAKQCSCVTLHYMIASVSNINSGPIVIVIQEPSVFWIGLSCRTFSMFCFWI